MIDNLELVREKGKIMVYQLWYEFNYEQELLLEDERELLLKVKYSKRGRANEIEMIQHVINHVYTEMNSIQTGLSSVSAKHKRAFDYYIQHSHSMTESRNEKYLTKIIETKREISQLENSKRQYKDLVSPLYQLFPWKYSAEIYTKSLEKKKQKLEEEIQRMKNQQQYVCS